jgi:hypothetical protein
VIDSAGGGGKGKKARREKPRGGRIRAIDIDTSIISFSIHYLRV